MTGSIKFNNSGQIRTAGANDTYALTIFGQPDNFNASYLAVTSANNKTPRFECAVGDGTTKKMLTGKLDSSLVWDGKNIVRTIDGKTADVLGNINLNHIYVKETWVSGTSWYRVWSDGYIEQGGQFNKGSLVLDTNDWITFPKAFSNTNYSVVATCARNNGNNSYINNQVFINEFNASGFRARCFGDGTSQYVFWYACGY